METFIKAICKEGGTGTKVHAAVIVEVETDELMYLSCGGKKIVREYPTCLGWNNNGFRAQKFHGFRAVEDFSQVTCLNCRRLQGLA